MLDQIFPFNCTLLAFSSKGALAVIVVKIFPSKHFSNFGRFFFRIHFWCFHDQFFYCDILFLHHSWSCEDPTGGSSGLVCVVDFSAVFDLTGKLKGIILNRTHFQALNKYFYMYQANKLKVNIFFIAARLSCPLLVEE